MAEAIELAAADRAVRAVHIGGGALTVPTWMQTTHPASRQTVFEIDRELIDLVVDEFDRTTGPGTGLDVVAGDARQSLRNVSDGSVDIMLGDAFGSRAVPWHLATAEFVEDVARVLRPSGIYALNVIDGAGLAFLRAETATIASVFPHVVVILSEAAADGRRGNSVIVASDRAFDAGGFDPETGHLVDDIDEFIGGATLLTDDFAPVDQLLAPAS
jgi:spermidine synthase